MDEIKIKFSDALMPGLITSSVMIVLSLILQYLVPDLQTRQNLGYFTWILIFGILLYYGIQFRNAQGVNGLTYGKSFTFIFYIMIIVTLITTIFSYLNFTFLNPEMMDKIIANAEDAVYNNPQIPEDKIEDILSMQAKFMTPGWLTFWAALASSIFSVIIALIGAIFVKKNPTIDIS